VADRAFGATVAKRRLSRRLAELREAAGYKPNQVGDKLNWGRGKVNRFEANQWVRPEISDIRDLLRLYQVPEAERDELVSLAVLARERQWWRDSPEVFTDEFAGFENDAAAIKVYNLLLLPGLLQTSAYMEALLRLSESSSPDWRKKAIDARLRRQEILNRPGTAPELVAVITETSLMYRWGSQADRRAQVAHLVEMSRRPNVEIRLVPFAGGLHPAMNTLLNLFDFGDGEPSIVYLEYEVGTQEVTKPKDVRSYTELFRRIRDAALDPAATSNHLAKLTTTLE
jgi:transcriptional regulator with XRE-family HTH domain